MSRQIDLLVLNNQILATAHELLLTPSTLDHVSALVETLEIDKQDRIPNVYYENVPENQEAELPSGQTFYAWDRNEGFKVVASPILVDYNAGLYYIQIQEVISDELWFDYRQVPADPTVESIPTGTYYRYSISNGENVMTQVATPYTEGDLADYKAGKFFIEATTEEKKRSIVNALNCLQTKIAASQKNLDGRISSNSGNITSLTTRMGSAEQDIASLQRVIGVSETYVGEIQTSTLDSYQLDENGLPNDTCLATFIQLHLSRAPKNGDVLMVVKNIEGETDEIYKFIYSEDDWVYYKIPAVEIAENGTKGIVMGTYLQANLEDATKTFLVDITAGEVRNIYIKIDGSWNTIEYYLNAHKTSLETITGQITSINSTLGQIPNTYMTQALGATKAWVVDRFLPKLFNEMKYFGANGYLAFNPDSQTPIVEQTIASASSAEIFNKAWTVSAPFAVGQYDSDHTLLSLMINDIALENEGATGVDPVEITITINTYAKKLISGVLGQDILLGSSSVTTNFSNGNISSLEFHTYYTELANDLLDMEVGSQIKQVITIQNRSTVSLKVRWYSNTDYPSFMKLGTTASIQYTVEATRTSQLTNDGDGNSPFATESYVAQNGSKIDIIKVNGETQTISAQDKSVDISVPRFINTVDTPVGE